MKFYKILTVVFALLAFAGTLHSEIVMTPYLQAITPTNVYLLVESDSKSEVRVLYGEDENTTMFHNTNNFIETSAKAKSYVHRINLDNLKPGTKYYYRVMQDGVDLPLANFTTPRDDGFLKVGLTGDNRGNPKIWGKVIDSIAAKKPDILLLTGDVAGTPKYKSWKKDFFIPSFLKFAKSVAFFNAVGNHEGWHANTRAFLQAPASPSHKQAYYSFEIGNALFVVLNNQLKINRGSEQYKFLEETLKNSDKLWKIIVFHKSAYVSGGHGEYKPMKNVAKKLFAKYGVTLALSGHSHFYQRNYVDSVWHITVAGGGASLYTPKKRKYTVKSSRKHHYAIFEIKQNKLLFSVYDLKGNIIDNFEINK